MRISEWSSDVCSSDLVVTHRIRLVLPARGDRGPGIAEALANLALVRPEIVVSLRQLRREVVERKTESRRPEQRRETAGQLLDGPVGHALALVHRPEHVLMEVAGPGFDPAGRQLAVLGAQRGLAVGGRDVARIPEEHTSELPSLMRTSHAVLRLQK